MLTAEDRQSEFWIALLVAYDVVFTTVCLFCLKRCYTRNEGYSRFSP